MIASVRGVVLSLDLDSAVIDVGGVGMRVRATPATVSTLQIGETTTLFTSMIVREDSMNLYGFVDDDERVVFDTLLSVSGVGPRLALASLAVFTPDQLRTAVHSGDQAALARIPGVGKKSAARMILELENKLEAAGTPTSMPTAASSHRDVVDALIGLGWTQKVAQETVDSVVADGIDSEVSEILRQSLRILGSERTPV